MWDDESWAWDQELSPGGCGRLKRERERVMRKRGRWEKRRRRRREVVRRASRKPREVGGRKSEGSTAEAAGAPSGWISAAKRMSNKDGDREFNAAAEVKVNFPANGNKKKSSVSTKTCSFTTRFTVCLIKTQIQTDSSSWKHKSHMFGLKTLFFFFHRKIKGPLLYTDRKTQNKSAQHRPRAHENQQNVKIHSHGRRIRCSFSRCSCFPRHVTSVRVPRSWPRAPRISHPGAFLIRCLKKKVEISSRTRFGSSFPAASQNFTPPCVLLLLLEEDTFVWLQEMKGSKTSTDQCREELLFFKKETWS